MYNYNTKCKQRLLAQYITAAVLEIGFEQVGKDLARVYQGILSCERNMVKNTENWSM